MKLIIKVFIIVGIPYIFMGGFLYLFQSYFLYHPTSQILNHSFLEKEFQVDKNITVKVFVVNPGLDKAVLYFGGNSESMGNSAPHYQEALPNHTIYLINYRGYGGSSGTPSEADLYSDALYIYDYINKQYSDIALIARSLGTGVATFLASERPINKLILITPFDSIEHVAQNRYPIYPINVMLTDKYDSLSRVGKIKAKVLMLIAENDQVVESLHSKNLIAGFQSHQLVVHVLKNTNHVSISHHPEFYQLMERFL